MYCSVLYCTSVVTPDLQVYRGCPRYQELPVVPVFQGGRLVQKVRACQGVLSCPRDLGHRQHHAHQAIGNNMKLTIIMQERCRVHDGLPNSFGTCCFRGKNIILWSFYEAIFLMRVIVSWRKCPYLNPISCFWPPNKRTWQCWENHRLPDDTSCMRPYKLSSVTCLFQQPQPLYCTHHADQFYNLNSRLRISARRQLQCCYSYTVFVFTNSSTPFSLTLQPLNHSLTFNWTPHSPAFHSLVGDMHCYSNINFVFLSLPLFFFFFLLSSAFVVNKFALCCVRSIENMTMISLLRYTSWSIKQYKRKVS